MSLKILGLPIKIFGWSASLLLAPTRTATLGYRNCGLLMVEAWRKTCSRKKKEQKYKHCHAHVSRNNDGQWLDIRVSTLVRDVLSLGTSLRVCVGSFGILELYIRVKIDPFPKWLTHSKWTDLLWTHATCPWVSSWHSNWSSPEWETQEITRWSLVFYDLPLEATFCHYFCILCDRSESLSPVYTQGGED